jgi:hypothetical protein
MAQFGSMIHVSLRLLKYPYSSFNSLVALRRHLFPCSRHAEANLNLCNCQSGPEICISSLWLSSPSFRSAEHFWLYLICNLQPTPMSLAIIDSSKSYPPYEVVHELEVANIRNAFIILDEQTMSFLHRFWCVDLESLARISLLRCKSGSHLIRIGL